MYCRNCGNIVADNAASCLSCGFVPTDGNNYCPKCGHFCIPGDVECVQCKTSLVSQPKLSVRKEGYSAPQPQAPQPQAPEPQPQVQQSAPQPQYKQPEPQPQYKQPQPQSQPQPQQHIETKIGPKFLSSDQRYCRNCGLVIPADAHKCPFCDSGEGSNYCHKCGSGTTSSDTVCSVCASPLTLRPNVGYIPSQPPAARQNNYNQQNRQQYTPPQQNRQQYNNGHMYGNNQYGNNQYGNNRYVNQNGGHLYGNSSQCDWLITLLLCIFLGGMGIHRFYTRNYGVGILQLISGGGCGVWWLIDLILIVTDMYKDGDGSPLKHNS